MVTIRQLKAKDVKVLASMLGKIDVRGVAKLQGLVQAQKGEVTKEAMFEVGFALVQSVASVTDEIWAWMADLAGVSVEEFNEMPFDTPKEVIMQLIKGGQFASFFGFAIKSAKTNSSGGESTT